MVRPALEQLPLEEIDLLLIENVGNLVCPAGLALGEHVNVVVSSLPEGDDKPYKYPGMFLAVDAVVINKIDLMPYLEFDLPRFRDLITGLNPEARIFEVSCKTGEGLGKWAEWLTQLRSRMAKDD
jgi:hydrogenase nickel incorporation protein HypB